MSTSHAAVNLPRLTQWLNSQTGSLEQDDWVKVRSGYKTVTYARELHSYVAQNSLIPQTRLDELDREIRALETRFQDAIRQKPVPSSSQPTRIFFDDPLLPPALPDISAYIPSNAAAAAGSGPLSSVSAAAGDTWMQNILPTTTTDTTSPDVQLDVSSSAPTSFPTRPSAIHNQRSSSSSSSVAQNQNRASNDLALSSMAQQSRPTADANDDDFLLPLKPTQRSARDELLDGAEERSGGGQVGMKGARELHDELGEELAKMSKQLKLNALHFSKSLEAEKGLLESTGHIIEANLSQTQSSKTKLSIVSSKTRGTTWLTFLAVLIVIIGWTWTYLLIRMT